MLYTFVIHYECGRVVKENGTGSYQCEGQGNEEERDELEDDLVDDEASSCPVRGSKGSEAFAVDTMKDVRRPYPWPGGLREIVRRLWRALSLSGGIELPSMVMLEFFMHRCVNVKWQLSPKTGKHVGNWRESP